MPDEPQTLETAFPCVAERCFSQALTQLRLDLAEHMNQRLDALQSLTERKFKEMESALCLFLEDGRGDKERLKEALKQTLQQLLNSTPESEHATSGVESGAVTRVTENAANQIMTGAEAVQALLAEPVVDRQAIKGHLTRMIEACGFQDLAAQRVNRDMTVLLRLNESLASLPSAPPPDDAPPAAHFIGIRQDGVDAILGVSA